MKQLVTAKLSPNKMITSNGYLVCNNAVLARTGKQEYLKSEIYADSDEDEIVEVDRKPEQVFSEATIASFENVPLTCEHPYENVTPENYKDYSVGYVRDVHRGKYNGKDVLLGTLIVTDPQCIQDIQNGYRTELSCGYDCDITEGPAPQQINIRGNHVALCEQGRAGIAKIIDSKNGACQKKNIIIGMFDNEESARNVVDSVKRTIDKKYLKDAWHKVNEDNINTVGIVLEDNSPVECENTVKKFIEFNGKLKDSKVNDADLAVGSVYLDNNNSKWQITKVVGNKYMVNIDETTDNLIDKKAFEKLIGSELKPAQALNDAYEVGQLIPREELNKLEQELYDFLSAKSIHPEYLSIDNAKVGKGIFITLEIEIDGDWKHEHLYTDHLIEEWVSQKDFVITGTDERMVEENGSDWYDSIHIYHIGVDKEVASGIKKLFVGDEKTNHNEGYSKGFYKKLVEQLEDNLEEIDEFEIVLDSDDEDNYIYQKNATKRELRKQINEYKNKK